MSLEDAQVFAKKMIAKSKFWSERYVDLSPWTDEEGFLLPTALMGGFGYNIANEFAELSHNELAELVALIEVGLTSDDEYLNTAVAAGLLEAVVNLAEQKEGLWPRIDAALGPEARAYADAYRNAPFMNPWMAKEATRSDQRWRPRSIAHAASPVGQL